MATKMPYASVLLLSALLLGSYHVVTASPPMMTAGDGRDAPHQVESSSPLPSFDTFLQQFDRDYRHDPVEYNVRKQIYERNVRTIESHNNRLSNVYRMDVNEFADRLIPDELHLGYDKYVSRRYSSRPNNIERGEGGGGGGGGGFAAQQRRLDDDDAIAATTRQLEDAMGHPMRPVHELPPAVDWRRSGVTTPVKNQGMCGSCWAFASATTLESHVALQTGVLFELSPQQLVSCAPNQQHCGGFGGCGGATAEIAYDLVMDKGIVSEFEFGYQDGHGGIVNCTVANQSKQDKDGKSYYSGAVAGIMGYVTLPANNYTILMNTVAILGPVAVSVACMPWVFYKTGVFDAPLSNGTNTDLDHLVVLEGYGTDQDTGLDFWLVRNSWGPRWGESGYIRLLRHSAKTTPCGIDESPQDGTACTLDPDGNEIVPAPQEICGNSGILSDSVIPLGGYLL
jgi:cathepsin L